MLYKFPTNTHITHTCTHKAKSTTQKIGTNNSNNNSNTQHKKMQQQQQQLTRMFKQKTEFKKKCVFSLPVPTPLYSNLALGLKVCCIISVWRATPTTAAQLHQQRQKQNTVNQQERQNWKCMLISLGGSSQREKLTTKAHFTRSPLTNLHPPRNDKFLSQKATPIHN